MSNDKRNSNMSGETEPTQSASKSGENTHSGAAVTPDTGILRRGPQFGRRTFLTGSATAVTGAGAASFFPGLRTARAQESGPVKMGFYRGRVRQPVGLRAPEAARGAARGEGDQ